MSTSWLISPPAGSLVLVLRGRPRGRHDRRGMTTSIDLAEKVSPSVDPVADLLLVPQPRRRPDRDQRLAPLVDAVERYRRRATVSFHCPAHRGGQAADDSLHDLVGERMLSADIWLDPAEQHRVLREAEDLAADLWGADRAFFLGNGSSGGNHAALLATLGPGDEVVVARDAHISTHTALVMTGARPCG